MMNMLSYIVFISMKKLIMNLQIVLRIRNHLILLPLFKNHFLLYLLYHILTLSSSHISSIQLSKTMSLTLDGVRTTGSDVRTQNSNLIVFLFMYSYSLYGCCKYC